MSFLSNSCTLLDGRGRKLSRFGLATPAMDEQPPVFDPADQEVSIGQFGSSFFRIAANASGPVGQPDVSAKVPT